MNKKLFLTFLLFVICLTNILYSQDDDSLLLKKISEIEIDINEDELYVKDSLNEYNDADVLDYYDYEYENELFDNEGQGYPGYYRIYGIRKMFKKKINYLC